MIVKLEQFGETNLEEKEVNENYHSAVKVTTYAIIKLPRRKKR